MQYPNVIYTFFCWCAHPDSVSISGLVVITKLFGQFVLTCATTPSKELISFSFTKSCLTLFFCLVETHEIFGSCNDRLFKFWKVSLFPLSILYKVCINLKNKNCMKNYQLLFKLTILFRSKTDFQLNAGLLIKCCSNVSSFCLSIMICATYSVTIKGYNSYWYATHK